MSPQVFENQIFSCGVLSAILISMIILKGYNYFTSGKGREEQHCRNTEKVRFIYEHLLFPLTIFSFLFTFLSSFINSLRSQSF